MSIHSHGDHIPRDVRYSATFAWWLADLLVFDYNALSQDRSKREAFWKPRLEAIEIIAVYARNAVTCFQWPDAWHLGKPYKFLIEHWQKLAAKRTVRKKIWAIDHQEAELFSVLASQAFDWLAWWEMGVAGGGEHGVRSGGVGWRDSRIRTAMRCVV